MVYIFLVTTNLTKEKEMTVENIVTTGNTSTLKEKQAVLLQPDVDITAEPASDLQQLRTFAVKAEQPESVDVSDNILKGRLDFIPEYNLGQTIYALESTKTSTRIVSFLTSDNNIIANRENLIYKYGASFTKGGIFSITPAYFCAEDVIEPNSGYTASFDVRYMQPTISRCIKPMGGMYVITCIMIVPSTIALQQEEDMAKQDELWKEVRSLDNTFDFLKDVLFVEACDRCPSFKKYLDESPEEFHVACLNSFFAQTYTRILIESTDKLAFVATQPITSFNIARSNDLDWEALVGCTKKEGEETPKNLEGLSKLICSDKEIAQHLLCDDIDPTSEKTKLYPIVNSRYAIKLGDDSDPVSILRFSNASKDMRLNVKHVIEAQGLSLCYPIYIGEYLLNLTLYNNYKKQFLLTSAQKNELLKKFGKKYSDIEITETTDGEQLPGSESDQKVLYDLCCTNEETAAATQIDKVNVYYQIEGFMEQVREKLIGSFYTKANFLSLNPFDQRHLDVLLMSPSPVDIFASANHYQLFNKLRVAVDNVIEDHTLSSYIKSDSIDSDSFGYYLYHLRDGVYNSLSGDDASIDKNTIDKFCREVLFCKGSKHEKFLNELSLRLGVSLDTIKPFWRGDNEEIAENPELFSNLIKLGFFPLILKADDNHITGEDIILPVYYNPFIGSVILPYGIYNSFIGNIADIAAIRHGGLKTFNEYQASTFGTSVCGTKFVSLLQEYQDLLDDGKSVECLKAIIMGEAGRCMSAMFSLIFKAIKSTDTRLRLCIANRNNTLTSCKKKYPQLKATLEEGLKSHPLDMSKNVASVQNQAKILSFDMNAARKALKVYKEKNPDVEVEIAPSPFVEPDASEQLKIASLLNKDKKNTKSTYVGDGQNAILIEDVSSEGFGHVSEDEDNQTVNILSDNIKDKIRDELILSALQQVSDIRSMFLSDFIDLFKRNWVLAQRAKKINELQKLESDLQLLEVKQSVAARSSSIDIDTTCAEADVLMEKQTKSIASKISALKNFTQIRNVLYLSRFKRLVVELQEQSFVLDTRTNTLRNLGPISFCFPFDIQDPTRFARSACDDLFIWRTPTNEAMYTKWLEGSRCYKDTNRLYGIDSAFGPRCVVHGNGTGKFCPGELVGRLNKAAALGNVPMYIMNVIQYIEAFNDKDYWGQRLALWDLGTRREGLTNFFRDVVFGHAGADTYRSIMVFGSHNYLDHAIENAGAYELIRYQGYVSSHVAVHSLYKAYEMDKLGVAATTALPTAYDEDFTNEFKSKIENVFTEINSEQVSSDPKDWVVNGQRSAQAIEYQKLPSMFNAINLELNSEENIHKAPDAFGYAQVTHNNNQLHYNTYGFFHGRKDDYRAAPWLEHHLAFNKSVASTGSILDEMELTELPKAKFKYDISVFGVNRYLVNWITKSVNPEILKEKYKFIVPMYCNVINNDKAAWVKLIEENNQGVANPLVLDFACTIFGVNGCDTCYQRGDVVNSVMTDAESIYNEWYYHPAPLRSDKSCGNSELGWSAPVTIKEVIPGYNLVVKTGKGSVNVLRKATGRISHTPCVSIVLVENKVYDTVEEKEANKLNNKDLVALLKDNKDEFTKNAPFIDIDVLINGISVSKSKA